MGVVGLASFATSTQAADRSWSNTAGGTFSTTTNWLNGLAAGVNDSACFSNSSVFTPPGQASYTISFSANAQTQAVKVRNDFVTFNLGGRTFTTTAITGNEIGTVGGGGTILTARSARLTIQNGVFNFNAALTPQMLIGAVPGGTGTLFVGTGGVVTGSPRLLVGAASAFGTLSLGLGGGTVTASLLDLGNGAAGRGNAMVSGPFSSLTTGSLIVGNAGTGALAMDLGTVYQNNGAATIANLTGSSGAVTVDTTARWVQAGNVSIGNAGSGTVVVQGGGSVQIAGTTTLGNFGDSTVNVLNGSSFASAGSVILGSGTAGLGHMLIDGQNSVASLFRMRVGDAGAGTVIISNGGSLVTNTGTTSSLAHSVFGRGFVEVTGGESRWVNTGALQIGVQNTLGTQTSIGGRDGGTLLINDGAEVVSSNNIVSLGSGLISVDGLGSTLDNRGTFGNLGIGTGGKLEVLNGGLANANNFGVSGASGSLSPSALISGPGSELRLTGGLLIGVTQSGALIIKNGGDVTATSMQITRDGGTTGSASIDGANSRLAVGQLTMGAADTATLTISNGGFASTGTTSVGNGTNSSIVSVSGANSAWQAGSIQLNGKLNISAGGRVSNTDAFVGSTSAPTGFGEATIQSGTWSNNRNLYVGGTDTVARGTGTVSIETGGLVLADTLTVWDEGWINLRAGGELRVGSIDFQGPTDLSGSIFNYAGGTLRMSGSPVLTPLFLDKVFRTTRRLTSGKTFVIDDIPTLQSLLILDGGKFSVRALAVGSPLQFDSGTFELRGADLTIGNGGLFGDTIVMDDRNIDVTTRNVNIQPDGRLFMLGGRITAGLGINNNGQILVNSPFIANFTSAIVNNSEIRVPTGATVLFGGNVTGAGSFTGGGTKFFKFGSNSSVGAIESGGVTIVEPGATLAVTRFQEASLDVRGNASIKPNVVSPTTSVLNQLVVTGKLDLANNALVIDYSSVSPFAQVYNLITTGFAGGSWNGVGINSSTAATAPNRAVGIVEASEIGSPATFGGVAVDSTSLLIRLTLTGDANLDRIVNISDFSLLAANFNQTSRWSRGDFNFDGSTNINDFAALAANFNQSLSADLPVLSAVEGSRRSSVPEPASTIGVLLTIGGFGRFRSKIARM